MSKLSRLKRIAVSLTPEQIALSFAARIQKFESLSSYSASLFEQWDEVPPFEELVEQVRESVESAMPKQSDKEVARAVHAALQEAIFRFVLQRNGIALVAQEERVLALLLLLLNEQLGRIVTSSVATKSVERHDELILKDRCQCFVQTVEAFATQLHALSTAIKSLEDRYFKGMEILFQESRLLMPQMMEQLERAVNIFNSQVAPGCPWAEPRIDLDQLREAGCRNALAMSADLVDAAKSETLAYLGNRTASRQIARRIAERAAVKHRQTESQGVPPSSVQ
jgi:hypothetical protein